MKISNNFSFSHPHPCTFTKNRHRNFTNLQPKKERKKTQKKSPVQEIRFSIVSCFCAQKKGTIIFLLFSDLLFPNTHLRPGHDTPSPNEVIRVSRKQSLTISAPRKRHTLRLSALLSSRQELRLELVDLRLLLEVEDDDGRGSSGAQPVAVRREDKGMDLVASVERVEVLRLVQIPEHSSSVLPSGRAERTIGGDGDGVDIARVTNVVSLDAAGSEFPNLEIVD